MFRVVRAVIYPVNEIFATIQGEATFTGTPAVFVRMQGCKVGCAFCDTKHTWDLQPENKRSLGVVMEKTSLAAPTFAEVDGDALVVNITAIARGARHVVLTGGEPADYDLRPLSWACIRKGFLVQVETSGTSPLQVSHDAFVTLSPKIDQAGGKVVLPDVVARANEIKYPIATRRHLDQLLELLARGWHDPSIPVWLQPLSQSPIATQRCLEWCMEHGFRLSLQTHKFLGLR